MDFRTTPWGFVRRGESKVVVSETTLLAEALSAALDLALVNVPELPGRTLVALNRSASMRCAINSRSFGETPVPILVSDVGAIFAAALGKKGADVMTFHDRARYERFNRLDSIVSIAEGITNESGGTNFHSIFEKIVAAWGANGGHQGRCAAVLKMIFGVRVALSQENQRRLFQSIHSM